MQNTTQQQRALALRLEHVNRDGARTLVPDQLSRPAGLALFHAPGSHFHRVRGFGLDGPVTAEDLAAFEDFYAVRDQGGHGYETAEVGDPSADAVLRAAGYVPNAVLSVLVREVAGPPNGIPWAEQPLPPGVTFARVARDDEAALARNIRVGYLGFHPDDSDVTPVYLDAALRASRRATADVLDGRVDGELVGASTMDTLDGVTYFYGASTLPPARRRGLQTALMVARLALAAERGSEVVAVVGDQASPTLRNARRLGFRFSHHRLTWTKG